MEPRHHISEETLFSYAAGSTPHAFDVVLASHMTYCPVCRERLSTHEDIAGCLLEATGPAPVDNTSLDAVFAAIDDLDEDAIAADRGREQHATPEPAETAHGIPKPLAKFLPALDYDDLPWQTLVPGVKHYEVPGFEKLPGHLRLLRIAPGTTIPQHTHSGSELTLILSGSYTDDLGRFQTGDIADLDSEISHQPIADTGEDCICLVATEGSLKFKGLLPRLVQPFIGF